jgi:hypothetical protein
MTDINNPTKARVYLATSVTGIETWCVIQDDEGETNNHGLLAAGFVDEAEAKEWLNDYLLEQQCREWEDHVGQDEEREPIPF